MRNFDMLWPEGREKALTFSYDDGVVQDRKLIALMRKNGLKGTFNLDSGFLGWKDGIVRDGREIDHSHIPPEEVAALYAGFEVAVHTVTHPDLCTLNDAAVLDEVLNDRRALEALTGYPVRGMAYPFGTTDARVRRLIAACGIRYSRGVPVTGDFSLPADPLDWACSCHHYDLEGLIAPFLSDEGGLKLLSVWGHAYEFDQKEQWPLIERQLAQLGGHRDVWYATNGEMFNYIAAYRALNTSVNEEIVVNESAQAVWVRHEGAAVEIPAGACVRLASEKILPNPQHPFRIWKNA